MRIDADAGAAGRVVKADLAGKWHEREGIFGVDATLIAWPRNSMSRWRKRSFSPVAMRICSKNDIHTADHLGDRVFDLDARVHLDEVELAVFVEEFERSGAAVVDAPAGLGTAFADAHEVARRDAGGGLLDDLLVPALHRAVARAEVDGVAVAVGEYLDFDVARVLEVFLHKTSGLPKKLCASDLVSVTALSSAASGMHDAHARRPLPPAALMITG